MANKPDYLEVGLPSPRGRSPVPSLRSPLPPRPPSLPLPHIHQPMCCIVNAGYCTDLTAGQFALTKQLVLRLALPHVSLFVISVCYAVFGSWVISIVKYAEEDSRQHYEQLNRIKSEFATILASGRGSTDAFTTFSTEIFNLYKILPAPTDAIAQEFADDDVPYAWLRRIRWNVFFSSTTLTSIGYGNDSPTSLTGRVFCVIFLFFGIPLYLITLADTAKFCTEMMNRLYMEYMKKLFQVKRRYRRWRTGRRRRDSVIINNVTIAGGEEEVAEFLWTHLEKAHFIEVPFLLVYTLLISYIFLASYLVSWIEGWTFSDAVYFVIMSVLTVGFGDLVPSNEPWLLVVLLLILLGLVLTTTCVDIVGAYYIDRLHFFGRRLDKEDPLAWLKAVQQKRIEAMKREAMRKLFETVTALHHIRLGALQKLVVAAKECQQAHEPPAPPTQLVAFNATADSVCLRWGPPLKIEEGKRYWYTITYKPRTPQRRSNVEMIDFIHAEAYKITGLKSFQLYEFSLCTTTRTGSSLPIRCQEYTEPCTVPTLLQVEATSTDTATISWKTPRKNNGVERYVVQYAQEPAPQFRFWDKFRCGATNRFTITDLLPNTRYIVCVSAEHNFGLAAMSKSVRFTTKSWWGDTSSGLFPLPQSVRRLSQLSALSSSLR